MRAYVNFQVKNLQMELVLGWVSSMIMALVVNSIKPTLKKKEHLQLRKSFSYIILVWALAWIEIHLNVYWLGFSIQIKHLRRLKWFWGLFGFEPCFLLVAIQSFVMLMKGNSIPHHIFYCIIFHPHYMLIYCSNNHKMYLEINLPCLFHQFCQYVCPQSLARDQRYD